jgi:hypothetical protein
MAAQQYNNNYHQPAPQTLVNQQWNAPNSVHHHYHGPGQGSAAPSSVQNGSPQRPQRPVPDAHTPGFTPTGHPVQQLPPHLGGTNVQSHMGHVCNCLKNATEGELKIVRKLCDYVIEQSNIKKRTGDCGLVGEDVSRECVDQFNRNPMEAKKKFWRRASRNVSQRATRAAKRQQRAQAMQPDLSQQWPVNTPDYRPQMVNSNAGGF